MNVTCLHLTRKNQLQLKMFQFQIQFGPDFVQINPSHSQDVKYHVFRFNSIQKIQSHSVSHLIDDCIKLLI